MNSKGIGYSITDSGLHQNLCGSQEMNSKGIRYSITDSGLHAALKGHLPDFRPRTPKSEFKLAWTKTYA